MKRRKRISIYGLVSEIGSVISAVKKRQLSESGPLDATTGLLTRNELLGELGDVMWYCFALSQLEGSLRDDILGQQIKSLLTDIDKDTEDAKIARKKLGTNRILAFKKKAKAFPKRKDRMFGDFQETAILTARTAGNDLVEISLAVLMQLGAQLMRQLLPQSEKEIHDQVKDRTTIDILGKIAWYIAAIATSYDLTLDEIAKHNIEKAYLRRSKDKATPLHDEQFSPAQQFPRYFQVKFLTVAKGRSRMFYEWQAIR